MNYFSDISFVEIGILGLERLVIVFHLPLEGVYVLMVFAVVKSVYDSICWFEVMSDCIVQFANTIKIFSLLGFDDYLCCKIVIYTILFLPVLYSTLISVPFLNCTYFFCFVKYLT